MASSSSGSGGTFRHHHPPPLPSSSPAPPHPAHPPPHASRRSQSPQHKEPTFQTVLVSRSQFTPSQQQQALETASPVNTGTKNTLGLKASGVSPEHQMVVGDIRLGTIAQRDSPEGSKSVNQAVVHPLRGTASKQHSKTLPQVNLMTKLVLEAASGQLTSSVHHPHSPAPRSPLPNPLLTSASSPNVTLALSATSSNPPRLAYPPSSSHQNHSATTGTTHMFFPAPLGQSQHPSLSSGRVDHLVPSSAQQGGQSALNPAQQQHPHQQQLLMRDISAREAASRVESMMTSREREIMQQPQQQDQNQLAHNSNITFNRDQTEKIFVSGGSNAGPMQLQSMLQHYQAQALQASEMELSRGRQQNVQDAHGHMGMEVGGGRVSGSHPDLSRFHQLAIFSNEHLAYGHSQHHNTGPADGLRDGLATQYFEKMGGVGVGAGTGSSLQNVHPSTAQPPPQYGGRITNEGGGSQTPVGSGGGEGRGMARESPEVDSAARVTQRMLDVLTEDNNKLRGEVEGYIKKTSSLQRLELEFQRIQREYEDLVRRQAKREELEEQMKRKVNMEMKLLADTNRYLNEQLDNAVSQMRALDNEDIALEFCRLNQEINRQEMLIAQLLPQNKELHACKERQQIELEAQRATLEEQRTHIQIMEKALRNSQESKLKMEMELKKKNDLHNRLEHYQQQLKQNHEEMQKREESHRMVRAQLEKELAQLHLQKTKEKQPMKKGVVGVGVGGGGRGESEMLSKLQKEVEEKDALILKMNKEALQWEKKYYEMVRESEEAFEEESDSKEAKIKELEEKTTRKERMMVESQMENEGYRTEMRELKNTISTLQDKVGQMEAKLVEKEALIKVLRRQHGDGGTSPPFHSAQPFSPVDVTRQRLEIVRRRLLQSPSPSQSRFPRIYHPKVPGSLDASFSLQESSVGGVGGGVGGMAGTMAELLGEGGSSADYSSLDRPGRHYQKQKSGSASSETPRKYTHHTHYRTQSSCDPFLGRNVPSRTGVFPSKQIFTLPRKTRHNSASLIPSRSNRPRSADDHLLLHTQHSSYSNTQSTILETSPNSNNGNTINDNDKSDNDDVKIKVTLPHNNSSSNNNNNNNNNNINNINNSRNTADNKSTPETTENVLEETENLWHV